MSSPIKEGLTIVSGSRGSGRKTRMSEARKLMKGRTKIEIDIEPRDDDKSRWSDNNQLTRADAEKI